MSKARHSDKRDGNEAGIVRYMEERGLTVRRMCREAGYDLMAYNTQAQRTAIWRAIPIEVKNPVRDWSFTDNERAMIDLHRRCGIPYIVIETKDDVDAFMRGDWAPLDYTGPKGDEA